MKLTHIILISVTGLALLISVGWLFAKDRFSPSHALSHLIGKKSVSDVDRIVGKSARGRLKPYFDIAKVAYPPKGITLLAFKDSAKLELWAETGEKPVHIRTYSIKRLSGHSGPKLREGDKQVPEGIYKITGLNPNSRFHLSMKLNYPNAFDLRHARAEGRRYPGTNIFIHGKASSVGCLAMGDPTIEELFILAADTGENNIKVVITPTDPRKSKLRPIPNIAWTENLYKQITDSFQAYEHH